jgi:hypothetical protein
MLTRLRTLLRNRWPWRTGHRDVEGEYREPNRTRSEAQGHFWAEFREGQREAAARASRAKP